MGSTESLNGREKSQDLLLVLDFSSRHFFFRPFFRRFLASEKSRFSSLFAAGDVLPGGTSATQRQLHSTKISGNFGPKLKEGGVRVCGIAVLVIFWCGVAVIFISKYGIAVFRAQAVCGEFKFYVAVIGEKIVLSR